MNINFEKIISELSGKARRVSLDNTKLRNLLTKTLAILEGNKELKSLITDIKSLVQLVKDWKGGRYKDISNGSIIMIIVGLLYLINPIDLIPDFLIGGFLDDAAVIAFILKKISSELSVYKEWKTNQENVIEIQIEDEDEEQ